jgi:hypothetical protein
MVCTNLAIFYGYRLCDRSGLILKSANPLILSSSHPLIKLAFLP